MDRFYDRLIIGAGFYGLYAALRCAHNGEHVLVVEKDEGVFARATYVNQARVHMGYHYPRSLSTALKSARYFERFNEDFGFCILSDFDQIYATSSRFSWTDAAQFERFCATAGIRCDAVSPSRFFHDGLCDGAFLTTEYTYDAALLGRRLMEKARVLPDLEIRCICWPDSIKKELEVWKVHLSDGSIIETPRILNATYASVNNVHAMVNAGLFPIKYELCEIILCEASSNLSQLGITVMDGPFFSVMPFGMTGLHSLTSVTFTPHATSRSDQPSFPCQDGVDCWPTSLANCNDCIAKPETAWPYMSQLARKYLLEKYDFTYRKSLFSMKPILRASEVDDSRPTIIRSISKTPEMLSVLSGKINTVYDLDPYLDGSK